MPSPQQTQILANKIKNAFNDMIPEVDESLPKATRDAMNDAMDDMRQKNEELATTIANAINDYMKSATVKVNLPWVAIKVLAEGKYKPKMVLKYDDIQYALSGPNKQAIVLGSLNVNDGGRSNVELIQENAIQ